MDLTHDMLDRLEQLEEKFAAMGQNMQSYLDGLLHADYLTYWDYIHLDTLLSLQTPKTQIPDEQIFILYHQITELYFKLILNATELIADKEDLDLAYFKRQLKRINNYFGNLVSSFDIMVDGMDKEEFLKFRMSLLPASGFQSAQYRMNRNCKHRPSKFGTFFKKEKPFLQNQQLRNCIRFYTGNRVLLNWQPVKRP